MRLHGKVETTGRGRGERQERGFTRGRVNGIWERVLHAFLVSLFHMLVVAWECILILVSVACLAGSFPTGTKVGPL